jgi:hypothetical protein
MNPQKSNPNQAPDESQDKPLDLDELLNLATIDLADIESAAEWWDNNASSDWVGALDSEPNDNA